METAMTILNTKRLGTLNALELGRLLTDTIQDHPYQHRIQKAADLAMVLHSDQTRKSRDEFMKTPYIEHPFRNTLRIIRWGIDNDDVIIGSLLHDVVEDCSDVFCKEYLNKTIGDEPFAQDLLIRHIEREFGGKVKQVVLGVTNPLVSPEGALMSSLPKSERNRIYREHVADQIKDPEVFLVKFSDYIDNAGGLYHSMDKDFIKRQAPKYQPLLSVFKSTLDNHVAEGRINVSPEQLLEMTYALDFTRQQLESVIAESGN